MPPKKKTTKKSAKKTPPKKSDDKDKVTQKQGQTQRQNVIVHVHTDGPRKKSAKKSAKKSTSKAPVRHPFYQERIVVPQIQVRPPAMDTLNYNKMFDLMRAQQNVNVPSAIRHTNNETMRQPRPFSEPVSISTSEPVSISTSEQVSLSTSEPVSLYNTAEQTSITPFADVPDNISEISEPTQRGFIAPERTVDTPLSLSRTETTRARNTNLFNRLDSVNERLNSLRRPRPVDIPDNVSELTEPSQTGEITSEFTRGARTYYTHASPFLGDTSQATPSYRDPSYRTEATRYSQRSGAGSFDPFPGPFGQFDEVSNDSSNPITNFSQHDVDFYKDKTAQVKQAEQKAEEKAEQKAEEKAEQKAEEKDIVPHGKFPQMVKTDVSKIELAPSKEVIKTKGKAEQKAEEKAELKDIRPSFDPDVKDDLDRIIAEERAQRKQKSKNIKVVDDEGGGGGGGGGGGQPFIIIPSDQTKWKYTPTKTTHTPGKHTESGELTAFKQHIFNKYGLNIVGNSDAFVRNLRFELDKYDNDNAIGSTPDEWKPKHKGDVDPKSSYAKEYNDPRSFIRNQTGKEKPTPAQIYNFLKQNKIN